MELIIDGFSSPNSLDSDSKGVGILLYVTEDIS